VKYYIIAGEASGDLHAANLLKELCKLDEHAEVRAWGGDLMQQQGAKLVKHYRELAFMGFTEVLMNIRTILKNIKFCKQDIAEFQPDALILVDYPGFNLRIAKWAQQQGIQVHYYISPQVWAWKASRVNAIKRDVNHLYCILPFEVDFYKKYHYDVHFVGHPLLDVIDNAEKSDAHGQQILALLPGSRKQEIKTMLPVMLKAAADFPNHQVVIAGAPSQDLAFYQNILGDVPIEIWQNRTYELLQKSTLALVTSGTATLETALFGVPQVVCYKGGVISYHIARRLIKVKYISLVNLILDKPAVKELIQKDMTAENMANELKKMMNDGGKSLHQDYAMLKTMLGGKGASERTARLIFSSVNKVVS